MLQHKLMPQISIMMDYLGLECFQVPHYLLSDMPYANYGRTRKEYKLHKDGHATYRGFGGRNGPNGVWVSDIEIRLPPGFLSEKFFQEAFDGLVSQCKSKVLRVADGSGILNLHKLILVFRGLNFITISDYDLNQFEYGGYGF
jgi:hypothetical protein